MTRYVGRALCIGAVAGFILSGCATIPADRGAARSTDLVKTRSSLGNGADVGTLGNNQQAAVWPSEPVDADAAVKLALLHNPRMRALYAELGVAQADVYDASRLSNPSLGYIRLTPDAGSEQPRTTWSLTQSFTELLFLNYRMRISRGQLLQAQQRVAHEVLGLEADVRAAYYRYVTAALIAQLNEHIMLAAQASSDYANSLFTAGNISELQLNRERANAGDMRIATYETRSDVLHAKGELLTLMGLAIDQLPNDARFVDRLDVPLRLQFDSAALRKWSDEQRVDLAAVREQIDLLTAVNTHTRRWRWLGGVELQAEKERETDGVELRGLGANVEVPLFNQGGGKALRARAQLESAQASLQALQLQIANAVSIQLATLDHAWQRVDEYRERLVPLRERIVELNQQQQNFMLIGAFETLAAKHDALTTYQAYLNAVGDYWVRYAELARTAGGRLPDSSSPSSVGVSVGVDALEDTDRTATHTESDNSSNHDAHDHDHAAANEDKEHAMHMHHEHMKSESPTTPAESAGTTP